MRALLSADRVVDLAETPFPVHPTLVWVPALPTVRVGDLYDEGSGTFSTLPTTTDETDHD